MPFICTADGHEINVANPDQAQIQPSAIAHALAQINRFNGHARRPYSVAEHSLLVLDILERELGVTDVNIRFAALMHDAHEAYCGDMHSPGKVAIDAIGGAGAWSAWEARWVRTVRTAFAMHTASSQGAQLIKAADLIALATERAALLPGTCRSDWPVLDGVAAVEWEDLMGTTRTTAPWTFWRDQFMAQLEALEYARNDQMFRIHQKTEGAAA